MKFTYLWSKKILNNWVFLYQFVVLGVYIQILTHTYTFLKNYVYYGNVQVYTKIEQFNELWCLSFSFNSCQHFGDFASMWTFKVCESEVDKWQIYVSLCLQIDLKTFLLNFFLFLFLNLMYLGC